MDLRPHIDRFARRFAEVEAALSDPKAFDNNQRAQELSKEYSRLKELTGAGNAYLKAAADLEQNRALLQSEPADSELALMAREDIGRLEQEVKQRGLEVQRGILPPDPSDSRNTIVEIRAGAGGSESALFAADLYRMFTRYAEGQGWKVETLDSSASDLGGLKEVIFGITGTDVYKRLKSERGPPGAARSGDGSAGADPYEHVHGGGAAGGRGSGRGDKAGRPGNHGLPGVGTGRTGREHDGFGGANPAQADGVDCAVRGPAVAIKE